VLAVSDDAGVGPGTKRDRLAQRRRALGLTQEDLAALLEVQRSTVVRWERGQTQPLPWMRPRLARALQVPVGQLADLLDRATPAGPDPRGASVVRVPRQLPAAVAGFTGRNAELQALTGLAEYAKAGATGTVVISAIGGPAGVGKTALAVHWGHQVADRFPDGQLYVNLRGFDPAGAPMATIDAVRAFLDALGVPPAQVPAGLDAQAGLYRSLMSGRRFLVLLDNARDAKQVRPLLPGTSTCLTLVTSRSHLTGLIADPGAYPLYLDVLDRSDSVQMIVRRLGGRVQPADLPGVRELADLCGGLPLALSIAAAHAATRPRSMIPMLASDIRTGGTPLASLDTGDQATSLRAVFSWSYQLISVLAAKLFRLLSAHPGAGISAAAAASLYGCPVAEVRRLLNELVEAGLLIEPHPGRFGFHDLLHSYAIEQAAASGLADNRAAATRRLLIWSLHSAAAAARVIYPRRRHVSLDAAPADCTPLKFGNREEALQWLESERFNLVAAIRCAAEHGEHEIAWKLPIELWDLFGLGCHWSDWIESLEVGLSSARKLEDDYAQAWLLNHLATARQQIDDSEGAIEAFHEALRIRKLIKDQYGAAVVSANLGRALSETDRLPEAMQYLREALAVFRETGNSVEEGRCLYLLSATVRRLGRYDDAVRNAQRAVAILGDASNEMEESGALLELALAELRVSDAKSAASHAARAAELGRRNGDRRLEAQALATLGQALLACRHFEKGQEALQTARIIFTDISDSHMNEWLETSTSIV
jgi:tetratricopeptide (TPR) repeat protein/transcriptional regulator with XRE-family HTH domain